MCRIILTQFIQSGGISRGVGNFSQVIYIKKAWPDCPPLLRSDQEPDKREKQRPRRSVALAYYPVYLFEI